MVAIFVMKTGCERQFLLAHPAIVNGQGVRVLSGGVLIMRIVW
jgi:hypothetical protein